MLCGYSNRFEMISNIHKLDFSSKTIHGLQVRTKNSDEVNSSTEKIAPLWRRFYTEILPTLEENATVYSVYHNYEYDASGEYDVLIGADRLDVTDEMCSITLEEGRYLMFPVKGELPHAIAETWKEIWHYFDDESVDERRNFETDFEVYISKDEVEIYVGVNYF